MNAESILVVEDETIVATDIKARLHHFGYRVIGSCPSGEQALEMIEHRQPDLVLMDIHLAGRLDGIETAWEIRVRYRIPVVFLTAYSEDATLERAKLVEPYGYILKPFEDRELKTVIEMALYKHRTEEILRQSEETYRLLFETVPQGIVFQNVDGHIISANPAAERILGVPLEEMLGRTSDTPEWEAIREDASPLPGQEHPSMVALRTGERVKDVVMGVYNPRLKSYIWINVTAIPLYQGRRLAQVYTCFEDISERKRAESILRESEWRLRQAQEIAGLGNFVYDFATDRWSGSPVLDRLLGIGADFDRTAAGAASLLHQDDRAMVLAKVRKSLAKGGHFEGKFRIQLHQKAEVRWLHGVAEVESEGQGQPRRLVGTGQDITEIQLTRQALENHRDRLGTLVRARTAELTASEAKFRGIVEQSLTGIFILQQGRFCYANPGLANIFGFSSPSQMIDSVQVTDLLTPEDSSRLLELEYTSLPEAEDQLQLTCPGRRQNATGVEIEMHCRRIDFGGRPAIIGMALDVTARHQTERAKAAALEAAERLTRLKSEFMGNISHELRTPLNAILGQTWIGQRTTDLSRARELFGRIHASGQHLLTLVEDILDFSNLENGRLRLEPSPTELQIAIDNVILPAQTQAQAKGLGFNDQRDPDLPRVCLTDPRRLSQILGNLLSNAVKFTPTGEIGFSASQEDKWLVFRISDTGIGMHPEHLERLFHPFEQANGGTNRLFGGLGLGLALSYYLVQRLGGTLKAESTIGKGSTFELRLPLILPPQKPVTKAGPGDTQRLDGLRILAVDDYELNRLLLQEILSREGARVTLAESGSQAFKCLEQEGVEAFDIILTDIFMPGLDGYETARMIRKLAPELPIIGLVSENLPHEEERCTAAGIGDFMVKPLLPDILVERIWRMTRGGS